MLSGTKRWLKQTVTHYPFSAFSAGVPTFGTATTRACRIERTLQNIITTEGSEVVSTLQIYLDGSISVNAKDKFVLPDSTSPPILSVGEQVGPDGSVWMKVIYA